MSKTLKYRFYFALLFSISMLNAYGQKLVQAQLEQDIIIPSNNMGINHRAMVFLPENYYSTIDSFPVVYLLHGHNGYYSNWYIREPKIKQYATDYKMIIVTPEGTLDSWYIDSPEDTTKKYESYIAIEVPRWVESHYRVKKGKENSGICGLSMGGHGALTIAVDYPEKFGVAGSISGVLDLRPFYERKDLNAKLGSIFTYPSRWFIHSFAGKIYKIDKDNPPVFLIDCGKDDKFFDVNENVHKLLDERNISHQYLVNPGEHNWEYWKKELPRHLKFFKEYFYK